MTFFKSKYTKRRSVIEQNKDLLELEVNGHVGVTGAVGGEEGSGGRQVGRLGERGLVMVKNSWTV